MNYGNDIANERPVPNDFNIPGYVKFPRMCAVSLSPLGIGVSFVVVPTPESDQMGLQQKKLREYTRSAPAHTDARGPALTESQILERLESDFLSADEEHDGDVVRGIGFGMLFSGIAWALVIAAYFLTI